MSNPLSRMAQSFMPRKVAPEPDVEEGSAQPTASPAEPLPHVDHDGRPEIRADDQLNLFRLLAGITSHSSMVHSHASEGGRPAANLGIYARVVHNEQDAKRGYKRFAWLINSCLGLQIIVAASLTAMGAAGANHSAVTVFGAINTIIAGVLTFLKGSGLPNRLKYYQSEWKWVREFIEQRERDFSRPGCDLDVYAVVKIVENMYEEVKKDLEASVPDRFAGFRGRQKSVSGTNGDTRPGSVILSRLGTEAMSEKLKDMESGFGSRVKNVVSDITHQSHVAQVAQGAARDIQERTKTFSEDEAKELMEYQERAEHLRDDTAKGLRVQVDEIGQLEDQARIIGEVAKKGLDEQVEWTYQLGERTRTIGEDTTKELGKGVERAEHIENNFFVKLKDLRSEIGNRAHLAEEAMRFLQEAAFHRGDSREAGEKVEDHHGYIQDKPLKGTSTN